MIPIIGVSFSLNSLHVPFASTMMAVDSVSTRLFTSIEDCIDVTTSSCVRDQDGEEWILDGGALYLLKNSDTVSTWMAEGFDMLARLNSYIGLSENIYSMANQAELRLEAAKKRKDMVIAAIEEKFSDNKYIMNRLNNYR